MECQQVVPFCMSSSPTPHISRLLSIFDPEIRAHRTLAAQIRQHLARQIPAERAFCAQILATMTADQLRELWADPASIRATLSNEVLREFLR